MLVSGVTIFSLSANATLAICGVALVLLVLWQDPRSRSNQYFALCMLIFSAYGLVNLPLQVARQIDLDPRACVRALAVLYTLGSVLLFNFVLTYGRLPRPIIWRERLITFPAGVLTISLALTDRLFTGFEPAGATYRYSLTLWGYGGALFVAGYLFWLLRLISRQSDPGMRTLLLPIGVLGTGLVIFAATPLLRPYSVNSLTIMSAVALLGRAVITRQVIQPLHTLNAELSAKNAELQAATQARAQFLANMSHELRTPLNSIIGYADLIGAGTYGELNDLQYDRIAKVKHNGRRLLELINDVLDLTRLEAGRVELVWDEVDTLALLDGLLADAEPEARAKGLSLVRAYGPLPPLYADPIRARQILSNLLSNAVKYTAQGAVIVRGAHDVVRGQVVISVSDTGPGIPPAIQEHLFELFQHLQSSMVREQEGTGMGLAIARRLTDLHGGQLWFESVVGQGSTFHVALPAVSQAQMREAVIEPRQHNRGPAILVIDGDPEAIELVQDSLEVADYRVYGTRTIATGLRLVREISPGLIVLDAHVSAHDGWRALETLRDDPAVAAIPLLIVSAAGEVLPAQAIGAAGYLVKPLQPGALLDQVRQLTAPALDAAPATHPPEPGG